MTDFDLGGDPMSTKAPKNPNLKEVMAKAGGINLNKLIPKKGVKKRAKPNGKEAVDSVLATNPPSKARQAKSPKAPSGGEVLKLAQREARELKIRLEESKRQVQTAKKTAAQATARAQRAEEVLAELRTVLGTGRDAKAENLPERMQEQLDQAKALKLEAQAELGRAQAELEALKQRHAETAAELDRMRHEGEAIIINPQPPVAAPWVADQGEGSVSTEEEVAPSLFSSVESDQELDALVVTYGDWVLGRGEFGNSRRGRLEAGVNPAWDREALAGESVSLQGDRNLQIEIRKSKDDWRLRFQHQDFRAEGTAWISLVRLARRLDGGTQVEHAVVRNTGAGAQRPAPAGLPRVLKDLLRSAPDPMPWSDFKAEVKEVNEQNMDLFVEKVLLNPDRDMPVVYVSRSARTGGDFSLDPNGLAKALDGLAMVFAQSFQDPRLLTEALVDAGAGVDAAKLLSCFDGGVRLYRTGFSIASDVHSHPLWTKSRLEAKSESGRARMISASVVAQTVPQRFPRGFSRLIEEFDLEQSRLLDRRMEAEGDLARQLAAKSAHIKALEDALEQSRAEAAVVPLLQQKVQSLDDQYLKALHDNERLEQESEERRQETGRLRLRVETQPEPQSNTKATDHEELLRNLLEEKGTSIGSSLRILQALYPDRVEVHQKGLETADNCQFTYSDKAKKLLTKLVTMYYDELLASGDTQASKVFGDDYSPFESANLSKEGKRARTFTRGHKDYLMKAHLKQTHGHSKASTNVLRIHFYWLAEEKKILIGHVGAHLPL